MKKIFYKLLCIILVSLLLISCFSCGRFSDAENIEKAKTNIETVLLKTETQERLKIDGEISSTELNVQRGISFDGYFDYTETDVNKIDAYLFHLFKEGKTKVYYNRDICFYRDGEIYSLNKISDLKSSLDFISYQDGVISNLNDENFIKSNDDDKDVIIIKTAKEIIRYLLNNGNYSIKRVDGGYTLSLEKKETYEKLTLNVNTLLDVLSKNQDLTVSDLFHNQTAVSILKPFFDNFSSSGLYDLLTYLVEKIDLDVKGLNSTNADNLSGFDLTEKLLSLKVMDGAVSIGNLDVNGVLSLVFGEDGINGLKSFLEFLFDSEKTDLSLLFELDKSFEFNDFTFTVNCTDNESGVLEFIDGFNLCIKYSLYNAPFFDVVSIQK